jgi:transcriptional regulator with XRE-family HTH domain
MTAQSPRRPEQVDVHVGSRLRELRRLRGISQSELANRVDVTFQQVQKYEKGTNRIGASRLYRFSEILDVSPNWFFEGAEGREEETSKSSVVSNEALKIATLAEGLPKPVRSKLLSFLNALAEHS